VTRWCYVFLPSDISSSTDIPSSTDLT
jgi:hypothetical protein